MTTLQSRIIELMLMFFAHENKYFALVFFIISPRVAVKSTKNKNNKNNIKHMRAKRVSTSYVSAQFSW